MSACFDDLVELDNVRVSDDLENMNFPSDAVDVRLVLDLVFLEDFDGDLFVGDQVSSETDFAKCALAEGATYYIMADSPVRVRIGICCRRLGRFGS